MSASQYRREVEGRHDARVLEELLRHTHAIQVGPFRVSHCGAGKCWIANAAGEGMETAEAKLAEHIGEYFQREY